MIQEAGVTSCCQICAGEMRLADTHHYLHCVDCGHEVLASGQEQTIIVNDDLSFEKVNRADATVRAQLRCLKNLDGSSDVLIDIGCGSGKFLHHAQRDFNHVVGVEISHASVRFARESLSLPVAPHLPESIDGKISLVTFWHSLEHMPTDDIHSMLSDLRRLCDLDSRVIISVPNGASNQLRFFKEGYAFYDVPNHIHQFTIESLDILMGRHGFEFVSAHNMPEYNIFGYIQGLLNKIITPHNFLYYSLKRNSKDSEFILFRRTKVFISVLLSLIFLPLSLVMAIYDQLFPEKAGVITRCYQKTGA